MTASQRLLEHGKRHLPAVESALEIVEVVQRVRPQLHCPRYRRALSRGCREGGLCVATQQEWCRVWQASWLAGAVGGIRAPGRVSCL